MNLRYTPLIALLIATVLFEPVRSGLTFASQSCDFSLSAENLWETVFNQRHLFGYTVIGCVAAFTFRTNRILKAVVLTFGFSILMELEQTAFVTGNCRLRDLMPNALGAILGVGLFTAIKRLRN